MGSAAASTTSPAPSFNPFSTLIALPSFQANPQTQAKIMTMPTRTPAKAEPTRLNQDVLVVTVT